MTNARVSLRKTELQNLTVDGCSAQAQAFECSNDPHTFLLFSLVRSFAAKGIHRHESVQGLNLNRWSISGLEPEMPVTDLKVKLQY